MPVLIEAARNSLLDQKGSAYLGDTLSRCVLQDEADAEVRALQNHPWNINLGPLPWELPPQATPSEFQEQLTQMMDASDILQGRGSPYEVGEAIEVGDFNASRFMHWFIKSLGQFYRQSVRTGLVAQIPHLENAGSLHREIVLRAPEFLERHNPFAVSLGVRLHDIGKGLDPDRYDLESGPKPSIVRRALHVVYGEQALDDWQTAYIPLPSEIGEIVSKHHEPEYPRNDTDISLYLKTVQIAEKLAAMAEPRGYHPARALAQAFAILKQEAHEGIGDETFLDRLAPIIADIEATNSWTPKALADIIGLYYKTEYPFKWYGDLPDGNRRPLVLPEKPFRELSPHDLTYLADQAFLIAQEMYQNFLPEYRENEILDMAAMDRTNHDARDILRWLQRGNVAADVLVQWMKKDPALFERYGIRTAVDASEVILGSLTVDLGHARDETRRQHGALVDESISQDLIDQAHIVDSQARLLTWADKNGRSCPQLTMRYIQNHHGPSGVSAYGGSDQDQIGHIAHTIEILVDAVEKSDLTHPDRLETIWRKALSEHRGDVYLTETIRAFEKILSTVALEVTLEESLFPTTTSLVPYALIVR